MSELIYKLMNDMTFTWFLWGVTILLSILFFAYCLSKEGRDEHGRTIIGTACFYGIIAMFIFMNILSYFMYTAIENIVIFANALRLVYDGFLIVVLISILVLRKIR